MRAAGRKTIRSRCGCPRPNRHHRPRRQPARPLAHRLRARGGGACGRGGTHGAYADPHEPGGSPRSERRSRPREHRSRRWSSCCPPGPLGGRSERLSPGGALRARAPRHPARRLAVLVRSARARPLAEDPGARQSGKGIHGRDGGARPGPGRRVLWPRTDRRGRLRPAALDPDRAAAGPDTLPPARPARDRIPTGARASVPAPQARADALRGGARLIGGRALVVHALGERPPPSGEDAASSVEGRAAHPVPLAPDIAASLQSAGEEGC